MSAVVFAGPDARRAGPLRLLPELATARRARVWAAEVCRQWDCHAACEDVVLVVSELVTNAIRHAGTELLVELIRDERSILVEVTDQSTRPLRRRNGTGFDETGNGLVLVDAICTRWGVTAGPTGKRAWAELQAGTSSSSPCPSSETHSEVDER